jgi:hypothetical protein
LAEWCLPKLIAIEARLVSLVDKLMNSGSFAAENAANETEHANANTNTLNSFFNTILPLKCQQIICQIHDQSRGSKS